MGVVYMAEQLQPIRRIVALKLIRPGMDSRQVMARFEAERQALAMMDHPHIAHVLDAGTTAEGRPYFVMELVKGLPITRYCDQEKLPTRERLKLFVSVCQAVQHAHQKGIIHRDLKPSNILVTMHDGVAAPKVIDFGVAKAINQKLTDKTLFTALAQPVGTPAYMSPEQAEMSGMDVDTRSDIYSLGVLLYELLTGTTPFDAHRLQRIALREFQRIVREEDPPKPSTRLSTMGDGVGEIAAHRRTEPAALGAFVRGELDWIVMRTLEKDRTRRYQTASSLSEDVQRFLRNEMVTARPPSRTYRLRKFCSRNKAALTTAAIVLLVLVAATMVSGWQAIRATRASRLAGSRLVVIEQERDRARAAEQQATAALDEQRKARRSAVQARDEALRAQRQAEIVKQFLVEAFASPDPEQDGRQVKVVDLLARAAATISDAFANDPATAGELSRTIATTYRNLGLPREAATILEATRDQLAAHHDVDQVTTLMVSGDLGRAYHDSGQLERAITLLERTVESLKRDVGERELLTLVTLRELGDAYQSAGRSEDAFAAYEAALDGMQQTLPEDHPETLVTLSSFAYAHHQCGQTVRAIELQRQALTAMRRVLGNTDPRTVSTMNLLAHLLEAASDTDQAIAMFEEVYRVREQVLGSDHTSTLIAAGNLARGYRNAGLVDEAVSLYRQSLPLMAKRLGTNHVRTLTLTRNLAIALEAKNTQPALQEASELLGAAIAAVTSDKGRAEQLAPLLTSQASVERKLDHPRLAARLQEQALDLLRGALGVRHAATIAAESVLGQLQLAAADEACQAGDLEDARRLFEHGLHNLRKHSPPPDDVTRAIEAYGTCLFELGETAQAERILQPLFTGGDDDSSDRAVTAAFRSVRAMILLDHGDIDRAKSLLATSIVELHSARESLSPRDARFFRLALSRMITLYEAHPEADSNAELDRFRGMLSEEEDRQADPSPDR